MNLGQLFGQDRLRVMQLEDELAEAQRRNGTGKPFRPRAERTGQRILDVLQAATRPLLEKEIIVLLGDVKKMTAYMAMRDLRRADPPLVWVSGSGKNNDPYRYAIPGKFK